MQKIYVLVVHFEANKMDSDKEYFYTELMDSSSLDDDKDEDETTMMMMILEETKQTKERALKFKVSSKGHQVLNRNRALLTMTTFPRCAIRKILGADFGCIDYCSYSSTEVLGRPIYDDYFMSKKNVLGCIRYLRLQKCTTAMMMLSYGTTTNSWDEYLWMSKSTCLEAMVRFVTIVVKVFGPKYLRELNDEDMTRHMALGESGGFTGTLESLNCMHWE